MQVLSFRVGPLDNNTYLVADEDSGQAAVVDPSFESETVWDAAMRAGWTIAWVLNTHAHLDHAVLNAWFVERSGAPLALHSDEVGMLEAMPQQAAWFGLDPPPMPAPGRLLTDGDTVELGGGRLAVVHTPGHSQGGVCFLGPGFAIVGDVLFAGSIGRTDLPGGDMEILIESIRTRLLTLPDDTVVYPGHGDSTTIGRERRTNPFL